MPKIDFQAQAGSSVTTFSSLKTTLISKRSYSGLGTESFSDKLQRSIKSRQGESGEPQGTARLPKNSQDSAYNKVKDAAEDEARNTEAPGGKDALTSDQESNQLEVKDENGNNTEIDSSSAVQEADNAESEPDEEVLGLIADIIGSLVQEMDELEASLKAAMAGISSDDTDPAGAGLSGLANVDDILANVQDLESAIQQLSQALENELLGSVNNSAVEELSINAEQLKIMLHNGKLMIREHFKGNQPEGAKGEDHSSDMLKVNLKLNSAGVNASTAADSDAAADQESGQEGSSQIKKIMMIENHKLNMLKIHGSETDSEAAPGQPETAVAKGGSPEGLVINNNLVKFNYDTGDLSTAPAVAEIDPKELADQIVKKFELFTKDNVSEIKLQLKPEFLGKMTIKLSMEEGVLTAKFVTDNQQVKNMLESNLALFKQQLEASGIKVEKAEVSVQLGSGTDYNSMAGNPQQQWQFSQPGSNGRILNSADYSEGYTQYAGEEPGIEEINPLYDDITGDSSVSYIV